MKLQQGDVLIRKTSKEVSLPKEAKLNHLVLAEGEATGHHHRIVKGVVELYLVRNMMFLKVISDFAVLSHEEHKEIEIPEGIYEIGKVREYDYFQKRVRPVYD